MTIDRCVKAVCDLAQHQRSQDASETKAALADKLLEAKINLALIENISITDAPVGITVSVADGKVTLAGTSANGSAHNRAGEVARGIAGVREIDNRITSVPSYGGGLSRGSAVASVAT